MADALRVLALAGTVFTVTIHEGSRYDHPHCYAIRAYRVDRVGSLVAVATGRVIRAGTANWDWPLPPELLRGGQTFG